MKEAVALLIKEINSLISEGKLESALDLLIDHLQSLKFKELLSDAILLKNSYQDANRHYHTQAIISYEEFRRSCNKITVGIQSILGQLDTQLQPISKVNREQHSSKKFRMLWIGGIFLILGSFFMFKGIIEYLNFKKSAYKNQNQKLQYIKLESDSIHSPNEGKPKETAPKKIIEPPLKNHPVNSGSGETIRNNPSTNLSQCEIFSDKEYFRASASGTSSRLEIAEKKAILNAKSQIAAAIKVRLSRITEQIIKEQEDNNHSAATTTFQEKTTAIVDEVLRNCQVICKNEVQEMNNYRVFVAVEMHKAPVTEAIGKMLTQDYQIRDYKLELEDL